MGAGSAGPGEVGWGRGTHSHPAKPAARRRAAPTARTAPRPRIPVSVRPTARSHRASACPTSPRHTPIRPPPTRPLHPPSPQGPARACGGLLQVMMVPEGLQTPVAGSTMYPFCLQVEQRTAGGARWGGGNGHAQRGDEAASRACPFCSQAERRAAGRKGGTERGGGGWLWRQQEPGPDSGEVRHAGMHVGASRLKGSPCCRAGTAPRRPLLRRARTRVGDAAQVAALGRVVGAARGAARARGGVHHPARVGAGEAPRGRGADGAAQLRRAHGAGAQQLRHGAIDPRPQHADVGVDAGGARLRALRHLQAVGAVAASGGCGGRGGVECKGAAVCARGAPGSGVRRRAALPARSASGADACRTDRHAPWAEALPCRGRGGAPDEADHDVRSGHKQRAAAVAHASIGSEPIGGRSGAACAGAQAQAVVRASAGALRTLCGSAAAAAAGPTTAAAAAAAAAAALSAAAAAQCKTASLRWAGAAPDVGVAVPGAAAGPVGGAGGQRQHADERLLEDVGHGLAAAAIRRAQAACGRAGERTHNKLVFGMQTAVQAGGRLSGVLGGAC